MSRKVREVYIFAKSEIDAILQGVAKAYIIGHFYRGEIHSQQIEWRGDNTAAVITEHTPEDK